MESYLQNVSLPTEEFVRCSTPNLLIPSVESDDRYAEFVENLHKSNNNLKIRGVNKSIAGFVSGHLVKNRKQLPVVEEPTMVPYNVPQFVYIVPVPSYFIHAPIFLENLHKSNNNLKIRGVNKSIAGFVSGHLVKNRKQLPVVEEPTMVPYNVPQFVYIVPVPSYFIHAPIFVENLHKSNNNLKIRGVNKSIAGFVSGHLVKNRKQLPVVEEPTMVPYNVPQFVYIVPVPSYFIHAPIFVENLHKSNNNLKIRGVNKSIAGFVSGHLVKNRKQLPVVEEPTMVPYNVPQFVYIVPVPSYFIHAPIFVENLHKSNNNLKIRGVNKSIAGFVSGHLVKNRKQLPVVEEPTMVPYNVPQFVYIVPVPSYFIHAPIFVENLHKSNNNLKIRGVNKSIAGFVSGHLVKNRKQLPVVEEPTMVPYNVPQFVYIVPVPSYFIHAPIFVENLHKSNNNLKIRGVNKSIAGFVSGHLVKNRKQLPVVEEPTMVPYNVPQFVYIVPVPSYFIHAPIFVENLHKSNNNLKIRGVNKSIAGFVSGHLVKNRKQLPVVEEPTMVPYNVPQFVYIVPVPSYFIHAPIFVENLHKSNNNLKIRGVNKSIAGFVSGHLVKNRKQLPVVEEPTMVPYNVPQFVKSS
ncbi:hypothetical protein FQA39_LY08854 [Lamprigera yunnana]|nr:hypothetical protein FQA39_LY08854 [Lamprigera yunnana]